VQNIVKTGQYGSSSVLQQVNIGGHTLFTNTTVIHYFCYYPRGTAKKQVGDQGSR